MPTIETERLILRDFVPSDWDALNAFLSDPSVTRYMHFSSWDEEERRQWLSSLVQRASNPHRDAYDWAITLRSNGLLIGWLIIGRSRHATEEGMSECGCGYALNQHYWGQGYMPEALQAAFTYAFTVLGTKLIHAECERENTASARVMQKCGMQYEGTIYDDDGLGNWEHRYRYVITQLPLQAPLTEEQLRTAHVGELTPPNGPIQIADYHPEWPRLFEREAERIRTVLGNRVLLLEHVGSTSVPGLAAKPRIDILLVVADSADEPAYIPALEAAAYVLHIREPGWYEHRLLKGPDTAINLHVFSPGCPEIDRMLLFRNWLRNNASDRQLYEHTKRQLARLDWKYTQNYADAKATVVEEILVRAQEGAGEEAHEGE